VYLPSVQNWVPSAAKAPSAVLSSLSLSSLSLATISSAAFDPVNPVR
jgi:hypothetical protein